MIVFFTARWQKRIPGLWLGILFSFGLPAARAQSLDLAAELMAEGDWVGARREALRVVIAHPDHERALLLAAVSGLRGRSNYAGRTHDRQRLVHLASEAVDPGVRSQAAYEAGRACWQAGDLAQAWTLYARAFQSAPDRDLFLRSGCALFLLRQAQEELGRDQPALLNQLATCRNLWRWELRDEVRPVPAETFRVSAKPAEWIVSFYRKQIGPAIGHRCSLHPSCSAYFLQASREHGLLGVPLIADRLVREPGVVSAGEQPILTNGVLRFADPLSDHVRATPAETKP